MLDNSFKTITLGDFKTKKELNLRVLRKVFDPLVVDYTATFPECSVYSFNKEWTKLQISGALFIVKLSDKTNPYLFILNRCSYIDPQDFHMELGPSTQISVQDSSVYLKLERGAQLCLVMNNAENAQLFSEKISEYWKGKKNHTYNKDPVFNHAVRSMGTIKI